jgi:hemerythrin-like domain-containing protein
MDTHREKSNSSISEPVDEFSNCHAGIFRKLQQLSDLSALIAPAVRARELAESSIEFFKSAIYEHHLDEERELFPAVLTAARNSEDRLLVRNLVDRLTEEHRALEKLWKFVESQLKKIAKGQAHEQEIPEIERLVTSYRHHAEFEETEFLPLAKRILANDSTQMSDLGMSLHQRHMHTPFSRLT